ncbi:MAG: SMC-Scp complex subunit ScpB [Candidatus Melainabacteria bacterium]|nr:SMC-Scp complex subunit ScpB [Candidatus Melainabacteria bacterium]
MSATEIEVIKGKIEAVLYLTDKPLRAQAISQIINVDVDLTRQAILDLINDYEERKGGLEIADDNGYILQVRDEYSTIINEFAPLELPTALVRTLSAIAIKQPVMQSEIIKIRGAGAYDHIKELLERQLINKHDEGRSPTLTTTKEFQDYFRLTKDGKSLRTMLAKEAKAANAQEQVAEPGIESGNEAPLEQIVAVTEPMQEQVFDASPGPELNMMQEKLAEPETKSDSESVLVQSVDEPVANS